MTSNSCLRKIACLKVLLLVTLLWLQACHSSTPEPTPTRLPTQIPETSEVSGGGRRTSANAEGLVSKYILTVAVDAEGNQWFGTPEGASKFDGQNWVTYTVADGLVDNYVSAIAFDKENGVWFGTLRGISRLQNNSWTSFTTEHGLVNDDVRAIAVDDAGALWFGTSGGISRFDGQSWITYTAAVGLVDNEVLAIAIDQQGNKWFGTLKGVSKFDGSTWTTYNTKNSGLAHNTVVAIAIDQRNHKWFGTWGGGTSRFDGKDWVTYNPTTSELAGALVNALTIDRRGNLWAGTDQGLSLYRDEGWTTYNTADGLSRNQIRAVAIDGDGEVLAGTWGGGMSHLAVAMNVDTPTPPNYSPLSTATNVPPPLTSTPRIRNTPTPRPTKTPSLACRVVSNVVALNVRAGPGVVYPKTARLGPGENVQLIARNPQGSWALIQTPDGRPGWVSGDYVTCTRALGSIPPAATIPPQPRPLSAEVIVQAGLGWQDLGIEIYAGEQVTIEYLAGKWTYWSGTVPPHGATGDGGRCADSQPASRCAEPIPDFSKGALIGKVGTQWLKIGNGLTFTANDTGTLYMRINDGDAGLYDNEGSVTVRVSIPAGLPARPSPTPEL